MRTHSNRPPFGGNGIAVIVGQGTTEARARTDVHGFFKKTTDEIAKERKERKERRRGRETDETHALLFFLLFFPVHYCASRRAPARHRYAKDADKVRAVRVPLLRQRLRHQAVPGRESGVSKNLCTAGTEPMGSEENGTAGGRGRLR